MRGFLKEWFTHSRNERRGIIALLLILVLVIVLPAFFPKPTRVPENMEQFKHEVDAFYLELERQADENEKVKNVRTFYPVKEFLGKTKPTAFFFDPNTADSATFCALGFSPKQAKAILTYRLRGKKFKTREDFKQVFVVSDEMYEHLYNYIQLTSLETQQLATTTRVAPAERTQSVPVYNQPVSVNLNTADTAELKKLKAIGPYYARRIVEYRNRLGGYYAILQLLEIKGMDQDRLSQFAEQVLIDSSDVKKLMMNTISEAELKKHPYVDAYTAKGIVSYRQYKGRIGSIEDLVKERILKQTQAEKLLPYMEY